MTDTLSATRGSDYAGLSRLVRRAKLLDRTPARSAARCIVTLSFFGMCWWLMIMAGSTWWTLAVAAALGVGSTQVAFLGHDAGHQQVARTKRANLVLGLVTGNLLTGLSIGWWVDKHNRHHANPNKKDHDPDIGEGVLVFTATHAANRRGRIARTVTRNQTARFFPLLTLEGVNLHVASLLYLHRSPPSPIRRLETALLAFHLVAYAGAVFLTLPVDYGIAFIAVHQAVFGLYMGCAFAPNHKGMPILAADEKVDYLRRQVLTSRNVRGGWIVDQLLGGLNYQIEHHLFPSMPRANLRRAQALVREYCARHSISYTESGLFASYAATLRFLHEIGRPLRATRGVRAGAADRRGSAQ